MHWWTGLWLLLILLPDIIQTKRDRSLTHWPLGDFNKFLKKIIFKLILVTNDCDISCEIALRLTSWDLSDDKSTLVQVMAWCRQATSHYLNQCWPWSLAPYGVTRPQWVNSVWPSDAIWRHRSGATLVQVMACCLAAPSHYLNKCWVIIKVAFPQEVLIN